MLTINGYTITNQNNIYKILKCFRKSIQNIHFVFSSTSQQPSVENIQKKRVAITLSLIEITKFMPEFKFSFDDESINEAFKTLYLAAKNGHTVYVPDESLWIGQDKNFTSSNQNEYIAQNYTFIEPTLYDKNTNLLIEQSL